MYIVSWDEGAINDMQNILSYIYPRNVNVAIKLQEIVDMAVINLVVNPYIYKASDRVLGAREMIVHPNYIVFYAIENTIIRILSVVHARRLYP